MRKVTEILHENLPEDYAGVIQAKVHVYTTTNETELHCFRTLRAARDYIAGIRRKRYRPLETPADHENPPDRTYLVWTQSGVTIE